jgi:hypothetical protein
MPPRSPRDDDSEGKDEQEWIKSDLQVGYYMPWSNYLEELRRWQESKGGTKRFNLEKDKSGNNKKLFKCRDCSFLVNFARRKAKRPGMPDQAECTFMSDKHGTDCARKALDNLDRKRDWGFNRVVRAP